MNWRVVSSRGVLYICDGPPFRQDDTQPTIPHACTTNIFIPIPTLSHVDVALTLNLALVQYEHSLTLYLFSSLFGWDTVAMGLQHERLVAKNGCFRAYASEGACGALIFFFFTYFLSIFCVFIFKACVREEAIIKDQKKKSKS